jgi:hypothetical protein
MTHKYAPRCAYILFQKIFLKKFEDFCRFNSKYVFLLGFFYFDQFIVQFSI